MRCSRVLLPACLLILAAALPAYLGAVSVAQSPVHLLITEVYYRDC
jgi:hypothetical protein